MVVEELYLRLGTLVLQATSFSLLIASLLSPEWTSYPRLYGYDYGSYSIQIGPIMTCQPEHLGGCELDTSCGSSTYCIRKSVVGNLSIAIFNSLLALIFVGLTFVGPCRDECLRTHQMINLSLYFLIFCDIFCLLTFTLWLIYVYGQEGLGEDASPGGGFAELIVAAVFTLISVVLLFILRRKRASQNLPQRLLQSQQPAVHHHHYYTPGPVSYGTIQDAPAAIAQSSNSEPRYQPVPTSRPPVPTTYQPFLSPTPPTYGTANPAFDTPAPAAHDTELFHSLMGRLRSSPSLGALHQLGLEIKSLDSAGRISVGDLQMLRAAYAARASSLTPESAQPTQRQAQPAVTGSQPSHNQPPTYGQQPPAAAQTSPFQPPTQPILQQQTEDGPSHRTMLPDSAARLAGNGPSHGQPATPDPQQAVAPVHNAPAPAASATDDLFSG